MPRPVAWPVVELARCATNEDQIRQSPSRRWPVEAAKWEASAWLVLAGMESAAKVPTKKTNIWFLPRKMCSIPPLLYVVSFYVLVVKLSVPK